MYEALRHACATLTDDSAAAVAVSHTLVQSRLDYTNSILFKTSKSYSERRAHIVLPNLHSTPISSTLTHHSSPSALSSTQPGHPSLPCHKQYDMNNNIVQHQPMSHWQQPLHSGVDRCNLPAVHTHTHTLSLSLSLVDITTMYVFS